MLKLKQNVVPTWTIDGTNKIFKVDEIIWAIQSIYVDWVLVTGYDFDALSITLDIAPVSTIIVNYFYREVSAIEWNGSVTLWDLKDWFYRKIGRVNADGTVPQNINKIYPQDYIKSELRKSYKRIINKSPEKTRIQQYAIKGTNGYTVVDIASENTITLEQSVTQEIAGMFLVGEWVAYDYYNLDNNEFQVKDVDVSEIWDKLIVGHRIPYGVQKVSSVRVDGVELDYVDERDFGIDTIMHYTIIKDWQGNRYLFLPYEDKIRTTIVKYVADSSDISDDNDIIDIPEEYQDVVIYDTAYRVLMDKEDERWIWIKNELWTGRKEWLLFEYQSFVKSETKNTRSVIGLGSTYKYRKHNVGNYQY